MAGYTFDRVDAVTGILGSSHVSMIPTGALGVLSFNIFQFGV
jgi:hypothetical protein